MGRSMAQMHNHGTELANINEIISTGKIKYHGSGNEMENIFILKMLQGFQLT